MHNRDGLDGGAERTMTRTLIYGQGYTGKLGTRCWAALITGSDPDFGLRREFLEPIAIERESFNRPRSIIRYTYELSADCLYELSESGERWFVGVYVDKQTDRVRSMKLPEARVKSWVAALDAGQSGMQARVASKSANLP